MSKKQKRKVTSSADSSADYSGNVEKRVSRSAMTDDQFNPDYTAIKQDLRRIGTLAVVFFVVLVALSFVL